MKLTLEHHRAMIFYDFKAILNEDVNAFNGCNWHLMMNIHVVLLYPDGLKNFAEVAILFRMKNTQSTVKAIKLEGQETVTANWYIIKCLPEILLEVNVRELMLHHDNASSHTAELTVEFLKQIKVIEHLPYSPV
ncbi:uncharacterized protein TNCV_1134191 [Trichonephila clavipes]|nr:uncharacterized protein TNCV_1134191 [Trichonephila clavipes]